MLFLNYYGYTIKENQMKIKAQLQGWTLIRTGQRPATCESEFPSYYSVQ